MTLNSREKKDLSDIRMEKTREFQEDARDNFSRGRYRTSVNRAYYALMNAARSLLILEAMNPETHDGIITMLSLNFVKKGLLPVDLIKSYKVILSLRTDVDYGDFDSVDRDEAEKAIASADGSIDLMDKLRKKLLEDMPPS